MRLEDRFPQSRGFNLSEPSLAFQAAAYTLTDALNQVFQLVPGRRLDALKPG